MNVLVLLIAASLLIATAFLLGFVWAVRSGQYEDTDTPAMRVLLDEPPSPRTPPIHPTQPDQQES